MSESTSATGATADEAPAPAKKATARRSRAAAKTEDKAPEIRDLINDDPALQAGRAQTGDDVETEVAREAQFPARFADGVAVEVAQRSVDVEHLDTDDPLNTTATHRKVFVLLKREWDLHTDEEKDVVHERNIRQVRQFMVSNGLRPDADVRFTGEEVVEVPQTGRFSNDSVRLVYEVSATPVSIVGADDDEDSDIELVHTVVAQDSASAQEQADYEAGTHERVAAGRGARVGDVPGAKPSLSATA